jgi:hypothetical protein
MSIQGNAYWSSGGPFRIKWEGEYYDNLTKFRAAGQERLRAEAVGYTGDPGLVSPGRGGTTANPRKLDELNAYKLIPTSPLIGRGLDLTQAFGENVGRKDYYGTAVPSGAHFEIGAYEKPALLAKARSTVGYDSAEGSGEPSYSRKHR